MKTARLAIILAVGLAAIVGVQIASSYKSIYPKVRASIARHPQRKPQVIAPLESKMELVPPASVESELRPVGSWKFVGSAKPKAAFESSFWAKEHIESTVLTSLISLSPEVRSRADQVLSYMTLTARSRLSVHTPEALIAFLCANSPVIRAFRIGAEHETGFQSSTITGELHFENGDKPAVELASV